MQKTTYKFFSSFLVCLWDPFSFPPLTSAIHYVDSLSSLSPAHRVLYSGVGRTLPLVYWTNCVQQLLWRRSDPSPEQRSIHLVFQAPGPRQLLGPQQARYRLGGMEPPRTQPPSRWIHLHFQLQVGPGRSNVCKHLARRVHRFGLFSERDFLSPNRARSLPVQGKRRWRVYALYCGEPPHLGPSIWALEHFCQRRGMDHRDVYRKVGVSVPRSLFFAADTGLPLAVSNPTFHSCQTTNRCQDSSPTISSAGSKFLAVI